MVQGWQRLRLPTGEANTVLEGTAKVVPGHGETPASRRRDNGRQYCHQLILERLRRERNTEVASHVRGLWLA